jgi:hypothetical protein
MQRASFNNLQDLLSEANQGKTPHRVQSQDSERSTHGRRCVPVRPPAADFQELPIGYACSWVCDPRRLIIRGVSTESSPRSARLGARAPRALCRMHLSLRFPARFGCAMGSVRRDCERPIERSVGRMRPSWRARPLRDGKHHRAILADPRGTPTLRPIDTQLTRASNGSCSTHRTRTAPATCRTGAMLSPLPS